MDAIKRKRSTKPVPRKPIAIHLPWSRVDVPLADESVYKRSRGKPDKLLPDGSYHARCVGCVKVGSYIVEW